MKILGIDHATKNAGAAVLDGDKFTLLQRIELQHPYPDLILEMKNRVEDMIRLYSPDLVALEKPMAMRNGNVARMLTEVYTACLIAALENGVNVVEITPQLAKQYTAGHPQAGKEDVAMALQAMYGLDYDEIAIPVFYKGKKRRGEIKGRLFDVSDAAALCVAAMEITRKGAETA